MIILTQESSSSKREITTSIGGEWADVVSTGAPLAVAMLDSSNRLANRGDDGGGDGDGPTWGRRRRRRSVEMAMLMGAVGVNESCARKPATSKSARAARRLT